MKYLAVSEQPAGQHGGHVTAGRANRVKINMLEMEHIFSRNTRRAIWVLCCLGVAGGALLSAVEPPDGVDDNPPPAAAPDTPPPPFFGPVTPLPDADSDAPTTPFPGFTPSSR
ncbi:MAG: hypothetical protein LC725_06775 [Lentisphaerae bacterium]|nr:hypothetical protein [Lentisphaerota bacterium]